jgi:Na+-transporting methylmalonyl-CoA/oxaloacetate decarboxylase gamma subunit
MSDAPNPGLGDVLSNVGGDRFTETTSRSWLQRIVSSFVGILVGLVLVISSIVGIFWNEGRAIDTERALAEGAGAVVSVDAGKIDPADEGKLVHIMGAAIATAPLIDPQFPVKANGLKLLRGVEMYQWRQEEHSETRNKLGGGTETVTTYAYSREWSASRNDSSAFRHPEGHVNPPMAFARREFIAADAKLGAFALPSDLIDQLGDGARYDVDPAALGGQAAQTPPEQVVDGAIYVGANPAQPRVGDLKISYSLTPNGPVSAVGRQTGASLGPYQTKAGGTLYMVDPGELDAARMFKQAESENAIVAWIIRGVALVAMGIGFALILSPLSVLASVIPFLGSLVGAGAGLTAFVLTLALGPLMIAIAWFAVRPLMAFGIMAAGLIAALLVARLRSSRRTGLAPTPPNGPPKTR